MSCFLLSWLPVVGCRFLMVVDGFFGLMVARSQDPGAAVGHVRQRALVRPGCARMVGEAAGLDDLMSHLLW